MKSLKFIVPLALFGVLVFFLWKGLSLNPREVPSPLIGKPAPSFVLPTLADPGRTIKREDLLGKVWVLNVWASWCAPCREEHPLVIAFAKRSGVPVYGLNYKDKGPAAMAWLAQLGNPYAATLVDADGKAGIEWGVYGVPETFVIDKTGVIRYKHIGPLTEEAVRTKLEPLVKGLQS
ncbi:MAG: DsbE family thiol:disulfide interchange protein [Rubrivivax sp.]|jgi:cytochrome c biogenesis protein CcmG/thiol:disulfide interchange protein DsbE|nr:DsbE family thiol:disulfide interchange protein [Rubrivivax sp.]